MRIFFLVFVWWWRLKVLLYLWSVVNYVMMTICDYILLWTLFLVFFIFIRILFFIFLIVASFISFVLTFNLMFATDDLILLIVEKSVTVHSFRGLFRLLLSIFVLTWIYFWQVYGFLVLKCFWRVVLWWSRDFVWKKIALMVLVASLILLCLFLPIWWRLILI